MKTIDNYSYKHGLVYINIVSGDIAGAESFLGNSPRVYKYSLQVKDI